MKKSQSYSGAALKKTILANARALDVPEKWAITIADKTVAHVDAWVATRGTVTETDIRRIAHQKLQQLHPDIAYIYQNRDKII